MIEPCWIDEQDALMLHDRLLALHGGAPGVRDDSLLKSPLARPRQHLAYAETAGIVRNHLFIDGNKRTGFVVGILFPELNGHRFTASEAAAANAVLALASNAIDENGYAAFLAANAR